MNLIDIIKEAGIVGAGGAGFPTHIKLSGKADVFIVNAAECEPLIETDKFLMRSFSGEIVRAAEYIAEALGAKHKFIALKKKYEPEIAALKEAIKERNSSFELVMMESFYPAGDEQILVNLITGKSIPEKGLPLDVGAVVSNVGTVLNVNDALAGHPVTNKYLSVVGEVQEPIIINAPIGTPIQECIDIAVPKLDSYSIVIGGPMMGKVYNENHIEGLFVSKTTGNIIVLPKNHYLMECSRKTIPTMVAQARSACIQCRMCTDMCPRYLIGHKIRPHMIMRNIYREQKLDDMEEYERVFSEAINCCDCGICEMFACPMALSPRKINGFIKQSILEKGIKPSANKNPIGSPFIDYRRIPTERLVARLGLMKYYHKQAKRCLQINPSKVNIALKQHIGAPAVSCVSVGGLVKKGDLIGKAAEGTLSANIHASIDGKIHSMDSNQIVICVEKE